MGKKFVGKSPKKATAKNKNKEEHIEQITKIEEELKQEHELKDMNDVIKYMDSKEEKRKKFLERIENDSKKRKEKNGSASETKTTEEQIEKRAKMTAKRKEAQFRQEIDRANLLKAMNRVDEER